MLGHQRLLEYRRVPRLRLPFVWILAARASRRSEPPCSRWEFSQKRGEKNNMGKPSISARLKTLFSKSAYIPQVVHKEIVEYAVMQGQQS